MVNIHGYLCDTRWMDTGGGGEAQSTTMFKHSNACQDSRQVKKTSHSSLQLNSGSSLLHLPHVHSHNKDGVFCHSFSHKLMQMEEYKQGRTGNEATK